MRIYFYLFIFIVTLTNNIQILNSKECSYGQSIKVGLIENNYIDYKYYIYSALDSYALDNSINFEFDIVNNNVSDFDIIFGEYHELNKLSKFNYEYPHKLKEFYSKNSIEIENNIFPLDLDTFIIINNTNLDKINFKNLSIFQDPIKYSLGMSLLPKENYINLVLYNSNKGVINFNDHSIESSLNKFKSIYRFQNKNIIEGNYLDVYESHKNNENAFTLFSDGILLNNDFRSESFQLFPQNQYKWNSDKGVFDQETNFTPISFFGFSAYLNNSNHSGFLCFLTETQIRHYGFYKFNIQLSPLSFHEIRNFPKKITSKYKDILQNKNKYIVNSLFPNGDKSFNFIINYLRDKILYTDLINQESYLN